MARGLGKGLNAFFPELEVNNEEIIKEVAIKELRANPYQPRKIFNKDAIEELKNSIVEHGILQPIIVRESIKGYEVVAGERRLRAAQLAQLEVVPVVVRKMTEQQMMELSLLENLQREDLTPIEEAAAYQNLSEQLNLTQEQLASRIGKSRSHVANTMRLLGLPKEVQAMISENRISMGHGRALLGLKNINQIIPVAKKIQKENLNVRQVESLVNDLNVPRETQKKKEKKNIFYMNYEQELTERFGTAVKIVEKNDKGKVEIQFLNKDDLNRILELLQEMN